MQIFTDQHQRLDLAFAHQHPFERVQRALPPLRRLELLERAVRW